MIRHESRPRRRCALLALDCSPEVWGLPSGDDCAAFEWAVSWLASVATHLDSRGFGLHLILFDAGSSTDTDGAAGPLPVSELLLALATVQPGPEPGARKETPPMPSLLPGSDFHLPESGGIVVFVAGDQSPAGGRPTLELLRPGLVGSAVFLDVAAFTKSSKTAASPLIEACCAHATAGGWHTVGVRPGMSPTEVWRGLRRSEKP